MAFDNQMCWHSPFGFGDINKQSFNEELKVFIRRKQSDENFDWYELPIRTLGNFKYYLDDQNFCEIKNTIFYTIFSEEGTQKILDRIVNNLPDNVDPRTFFNSYMKYLDDYYEALPEGRIESREAYGKSFVDCYWTLDDDTQDPKDWEFFDERLTVHLSWTYEGKLYELKCYGYMTSIAFLEDRIKKTSPYYRRFMHVVKYFHHQYADSWMCRVASAANSIHPLDREKFLMQYAEVEGQPNFYER